MAERPGGPPQPTWGDLDDFDEIPSDWQRGSGPRSLDALEGFYIDRNLRQCLLITAESPETLVIAVWDTPEAAFDGDAGDVRGDPVVINLRTGKALLELPVTGWRWPLFSVSSLPLRAIGEMIRWYRILRWGRKTGSDG